MNARPLHGAPRGQTPHPRRVDADDDSGSEVHRALTIFLAERSRLFRIAHRVTSDADTADDVVQEVWLRWQRTDRRLVKNPSAFLATATTHFAINVIQSARSRHETTATSSALADLVDTSTDATQQAERSEAVTTALRLVLTTLTPAERAAYLLRKGFEYPYREIAEVLQINIPHARQLVRRAQGNLNRRRGRAFAAEEHRRLVDAFLAAARTGDLKSLESLLAEDAGRSGQWPQGQRRSEPLLGAIGQEVVVTSRTATRSLLTALPSGTTRTEDDAS